MPRIIKMAKGTYTASTITVDGEGRVITAASGSGGGATGTTTIYNSPGTHTASNNSIYMMVAAAGGGGGSSYQTNAGNNGNTTNFGTHASAPGGNKFSPGVGPSTAGTYSNNLYWAVGNTQAGAGQNKGRIGGAPYTQGEVGGSPVIALSGAGSGGWNPLSSGGGSGGVDAKYLTEPQYTAGTGIPVTIGTGGTGTSNGTSGRVVVVEYAT